MRPILPPVPLAAGEPEEGFMDKRGGLERLACRLLRHLGRREPAEFVINERQKFLGGLGVALLDAVENASNLAHGRKFSLERSKFKALSRGSAKTRGRER